MPTLTQTEQAIQSLNLLTLGPKAWSLRTEILAIIQYDPEAVATAFAALVQAPNHRFKFLGKSKETPK